MKKFILAAAAAMMLLTTTGTAQAEQLYTRLPNGQFVRVEAPRHNAPQQVQRYNYRPAPVYYAPQPRYVPQRYKAQRYAPVQYRPATPYCPPQHRR